MFIEIIPNGVIAWWAGVVSDDFRNDSFPAVRSAVNAHDGGREVVVTAGGFVRFESDLSFETAFGANDSAIFGLNEEYIITSTGHITFVNSELFKRFS